MSSQPAADPHIPSPTEPLPMPRQELFEIVDEDGRVIGTAPRSECHGNPALLHQVAHVLLFRSSGDLILQWRPASKDIQPSTWDTSVGGHVDLGERPADAAVRELHEELGVRDLPLTFCYRYIHRSPVESELVHTYYAQYDGPLAPDPDEVPEARAWTPAEIDAALGTGAFTPNFEQEWDRIRAWLAARATTAT